jgi:hypothetical protein
MVAIKIKSFKKIHFMTGKKKTDTVTGRIYCQLFWGFQVFLGKIYDLYFGVKYLKGKRKKSIYGDLE